MTNMFKYAHHLGFNNPYYSKDKQPFSFDTKFESIISKTIAQKTINPTALLSFFNKFYFLAIPESKFRLGKQSIERNYECFFLG